MENKRNELVDFYKGFLMWGVILGHTITALKGGQDIGPIFIHTFLRVYDMPFFMILAGFFLTRSISKHGVKKVFLNRTSMILFPLLLWNIVSLNFHLTSFYFLWAVFISSVICLFSDYIVEKLKGNSSMAILLESIFILMLYEISIPWNLFYLFPFFIIGKHIKNIDFQISHFVLLLFAFVLGMCFWHEKYSPFSLGADDWKSDKMNIILYIYRFLLGILGTYIVANVLKIFYIVKWGGQKILLKAGKQTLALYILQSFIVEKFLNRVIKKIISFYEFTYNDSIVNIIGYVLAPIISFVIIIILSQVIDKLETYKYTKYFFGFKTTV